MDKQQRTPLLEMINQQNIEGVRLLIKKGCNVNRIKCIKKEVSVNGKVEEVEEKSLPVDLAQKKHSIDLSKLMFD